MNSKTRELKESNDRAIAAFDLEIQVFQDLVAQYQAIGSTSIPEPKDREPGTWGSGKSGT